MSSLSEILAPNQNVYTARSGGSYITSRTVTHNGTTIAIALGKSADGKSRFFDYSILNAEEEETEKSDDKSKKNKGSGPQADEELDSQSWFENAQRLVFANEVRVVGEEAVPAYQIPMVDQNNRKLRPSEVGKRDPWRSTSLCLMNPDVSHFEVLSDGKYIYLFRQGSEQFVTSPNDFMTEESETGLAPVDGHLICDRFTWVGRVLQQALEARYKRSGQKRVPLNEQDTLGVRDMNDKPFFEPTHSLHFLGYLRHGGFSVLRAPTRTNDTFRWNFFIYSPSSRTINYITADSSADGLFDLQGKVYYTCTSTSHDEVFATDPGSCTACHNETGEQCNKPRVPIVPKSAVSERAAKIRLNRNMQFETKNRIDLSKFSDGFTIELWVKLEPFWTDAEKTKLLEPTGAAMFCLFTQPVAGSPAFFIDDRLKIAVHGENKWLLRCEDSLKSNDWNHIAVTYSPSTRVYTVISNGNVSGTVTLSKDITVGTLGGFSFVPETSGHANLVKGYVDEARLWKLPLHPGTIKSQMAVRATGMEPYLEGCWHFDEEVGTTAYDAGMYDKNLIITLSEEEKKEQPQTWQAEGEVAPLVSNFGVSKRTIRIQPKMNYFGGLGSVIYNEQVSVSEEDSGSGNSSTLVKGESMKRSARVLLSFSGSVDEEEPRNLFFLDFGLISNGQICDFPAVIDLPTLKIDTRASMQTAATKLLHVDAQGTEVFGGVFQYADAKVTLSRDPPCLFESAIGKVKVYFNGRGRLLSALEYEVSRSIVVKEHKELGDGFLVASKLRQAKDTIVQTEACAWSPPTSVLVNLTVTTSLSGGKPVTECWKGEESQIRRVHTCIKYLFLLTCFRKVSLRR